MNYLSTTLFSAALCLSLNNYTSDLHTKDLSLQSHDACSSSQSQMFNCNTQHQLNLNIVDSDIPDDKLTTLLNTYATELPSLERATQHIEEIQRRHESWSNKFSRTINHLQNPTDFKPVRYPSRMMIFGPSGCSKTYTALALAKVCEMECLFIHGSSVENTCRDSGSIFLDNLFLTLQRHPERNFLVIFDEIKALLQFSKDTTDTDQHTTAFKFLQCLDSIKNQRHICVVGTDCTDPKNYEPQTQKRFFNSTFKFEKADTAAIARIIIMDLPPVRQNISLATHASDAERESSPENQKASPTNKGKSRKSTSPWTVNQNTFDETFNSYSASIPHLSEDEIIELKQSAIEIAIHEKLTQATPTSDRRVTVELKHFDEAWKDHKQSFLQRLFSAFF